MRSGENPSWQCGQPNNHWGALLDTRVPVSTPCQCEVMCKQTDDCVAWTHVPKNKKCHLRKDLGWYPRLSYTNLNMEDDMRSGEIPTPAPTTPAPMSSSACH